MWYIILFISLVCSIVCVIFVPINILGIIVGYLVYIGGLTALVLFTFGFIKLDYYCLKKINKINNKGKNKRL